MKWKDFGPEFPRKEHGRVLTRLKGHTRPNASSNWCDTWTADRQWLDHLDDSDDSDDSGDGWIPVSSGRNPTKEDGCPDGPMRGYVYAQLSDGVFSRVMWDASGFKDGTIVAWRRLPAPYIPPEPPLWESDEERDTVVDAYFDSCDDAMDHYVDGLQRELRKRGYAIRKLEGE